MIQLVKLLIENLKEPKVGTTIKVTNVNPQEFQGKSLPRGYEDIKVGDELKITDKWLNAAGVVFGTDKNPKQGLDIDDIKILTSPSKIKSETTFTRKYDDNPKLKGKQTKLPDELQAKLVKEDKVMFIKTGDTFILGGNLGKFKKGEKVKVINKRQEGDDINLILTNGKVTDSFTIDKNEDIENEVESIDEMGRKKIYDRPEDRPSFYKKKGTPRGGKEPVPSDVKNQFYLFKITTDGGTAYRILPYTIRTAEALKQQLISQAKSVLGTASDRALLKNIRNNPDFKVELLMNDSDKSELQKYAKELASDDPDYVGKVGQIGHSGSGYKIKIIPVPKEYAIHNSNGEKLFISDIAVQKNKELKNRVSKINYVNFKGGQ